MKKKNRKKKEKEREKMSIQFPQYTISSSLAVLVTATG